MHGHPLVALAPYTYACLVNDRVYALWQDSGTYLSSPLDQEHARRMAQALLDVRHSFWALVRLELDTKARDLEQGAPTDAETHTVRRADT